jgi:hypothetical protein
LLDLPVRITYGTVKKTWTLPVSLGFALLGLRFSLVAALFLWWLWLNRCCEQMMLAGGESCE